MAADVIIKSVSRPVVRTVFCEHAIVLVRGGNHLDDGGDHQNLGCSLEFFIQPRPLYLPKNIRFVPITLSVPTISVGGGSMEHCIEVDHVYSLLHRVTNIEHVPGVDSLLLVRLPLVQMCGIAVILKYITNSFWYEILQV